MKASEIKEALDPQVKKASQSAVNKIKADIKKQNQMKKNMPTKKEEKIYIKKDTSFDGLKQIVEMKKQKAVANELDSLIHDQEEEKERRKSGNSQEKETKTKTPSPLELYLAANPEKIKDMTMEEVTKLSMLMNSSGNSDPLVSLMMMGMNKNNNGGENDLTNKILGVVIEKMFKNEGNDKKSGGNGDMDIIKMMMQQNMQTQQMLMGMITQQNTPKQENQNNVFMKEIFGMIKGQSDLENSILRDKLKELEIRQNQTDPLGEAKRMLDYVKTFGGAFGGGTTTPEAMIHELKLKELTFEQQRQINEEARRSASMNQIGGMINNTIETFGKILSEPIAEAAKVKLDQFTENVKHPEQKPKKPRMKVSKGQLQEEIDLGNLENLEEELAQYEEIPERQETRRAVFKVSESGK